MSDLANVWRGSKEKKPSRNDEVLAWFTSTIIKDTSIDNIQKAKLFEDYRDILKKKNEGKATKKELDRYTFNKVFLDIKDGDLTDRKINDYCKDHNIGFKVKQRSVKGWDIIRKEETTNTTQSGANTEGGNQ